MKMKIVLSVLTVMALTIAGLFLIRYTTKEEDFEILVREQRPRSEAYLRCEKLVNVIRAEENCDHKWKIFNDEFRDCENFPPEIESKEPYRSLTFREVIFDIGRCFGSQKNYSKIEEVFKRGLKFEDWVQEEIHNSYSAHFMMKREMELFLPSPNPQCFDLKSVGEKLKSFAIKKDVKILRELIFSENTLDLSEMSSDVGGYMSFTEFEEGFEKFKDQYNLKFEKPIGENCFLTTGWDPEYPWRGFCFEKRGDKGCYYLMEIFAGVKETQEDFESYKTSIESHDPI